MDTVLSILVLATIALVVGAFLLWRRGGAMKQVILMLILAAVFAVNVAIWTVPDKSGEAPAEKAGALAQ
jgi:multisubunit Na+/H+ antiporter MnhC subunit